MFKIGDKVECLDTSSSGSFITGHFYTVKSYDSRTRLVYVEKDEKGNSNGWMERHFKLVTRNSGNAFLSVLNVAIAALEGSTKEAHAVPKVNSWCECGNPKNPKGQGHSHWCQMFKQEF